MKRLIAMFTATALIGGSLVMGDAALAQGRNRGEAQASRDNGRGNEGRQGREAPVREAPPMREPQGRERQVREPQRREDRDSRPYPGQSNDPRNNERRAYPQQAAPRDERRAYAPPPQVYSREEAPSARRGGYLPPEAGGGIVNDLNRYQLRPPPRGYSWVRVNGGFALVSQATGQIFDIVPF
jgi:Ni/Co efflux regulator RcnB